jgi:glycosyltransferase involved in cell wall biosynthesis
MDVFAAPSEQETFGLAVLEALAAGLPVLYTTCPPLDELGDPSMAPHATKLKAEPALFREAISRELSTLDATHRRHCVPPAVTAHDIKRLATTLDDLYADLKQQVATGEGR